jgi:dihydrofolate reductase
MPKVIVTEFLSLDGVAQAPGGPEEDTSGGFAHGGWHMAYGDETLRKWVMSGINDAAGFLLGRRTYEIFASYWPIAPEAPQEVAEPLNTKPKHVATTTLSDPLEWENSTVLQGEVPEAVKALKNGDGGDLYVIGSTALTQSLVQHGLVDELRLMITPILLGGGKRIFPEDGALRRMSLASHEVMSTGGILATYVPD